MEPRVWTLSRSQCLPCFASLTFTSCQGVDLSVNRVQISLCWVFSYLYWEMMYIYLDSVCFKFQKIIQVIINCSWSRQGKSKRELSALWPTQAHSQQINGLVCILSGAHRDFSVHTDDTLFTMAFFCLNIFSYLNIQNTLSVLIKLVFLMKW